MRGRLKYLASPPASLCHTKSPTRTILNTRETASFDDESLSFGFAAADEYKSKVDDMLKGFNQQAFDWQDGEESRVVRECRHLMASRRDPNHDFYGYRIKFHFPTRNESVFVSTCRTCIDQDPSVLEFAVACVQYNVLSEVTMRREIVNTMKDGLRMEATSERSKKLMDEVFQKLRCPLPL